MNMEIGSEFWDIPVEKDNHLFPDDTYWFVSGRSALKAIIADNSITTATLPIWCCDSMIKPFIETGVKVSFYKDEPINADVALVMDYFGYATDKSYCNYPGIVIRDLTQSLFSKEYHDADYYFGSLRKWAGFWTGGYAWGFRNRVLYSEDNTSYSDLRRKAMDMKAQYICGKIDSKEYLSVFEQAEKKLENVGILPADERDRQAAQLLDISKLKEKRRKNASVLLETLGEYAFFPDMKEDDCPMFVPICVPDGKRDELRQCLIQNKIYCPVHWPVSKYHHLDRTTEQLYSQELSLVCDQRYSEVDMERMAFIIKQFFIERAYL